LVFGIDVIVVRVVALPEDVIVDGTVVVTLDVVRRVDAVVVRLCKATDCTRAVARPPVFTPLVEVVIVEVFDERSEDGRAGVDSNEEMILVRFNVTCGVGGEGTLLDSTDSSEPRIDERMLVTLGIDRDAVKFTDMTGGRIMPALTEVGSESLLVELRFPEPVADAVGEDGPEAGSAEELPVLVTFAPPDDEELPTLCEPADDVSLPVDVVVVSPWPEVDVDVVSVVFVVEPMPPGVLSAGFVAIRGGRVSFVLGRTSSGVSDVAVVVMSSMTSTSVRLALDENIVVVNG
jgi:hypothetical protein